MRVETGVYTGDDTDDRTIDVSGNITGDCSSVNTVIIVNSKGANSGAYCTTDNFDANNAKVLHGGVAQTTGLIDGLTTGAFNVSGILNSTAGVTSEYVYFVIQYDGVTRDIETGNYAGDGNDDRTDAITFTNSDPPGAPQAACVVSEGAHHATIRNDDEGATVDDTLFVGGGSAAVANYIQKLSQGNCEIGSHNRVNNNSTSYNYFVLWEVSGVFDTQEYAGDGIDNRTDAFTLTFQPDFAYITGDLNASRFMKEAETDGQDAAHNITDAVERTNRIQDFHATGIEIGDHADVNSDTVEYYPFCFKKSAGTAVGVKLRTLTLMGAGK